MWGRSGSRRILDRRVKKSLRKWFGHRPLVLLNLLYGTVCHPNDLTRAAWMDRRSSSAIRGLWDPNGYSGSRFRLTLDVDIPAHSIDEALRDSEAESISVVGSIKAG